ncbi:UDP-N-acetylglucosamine 1-carboxyvinyltransferase [Ningiella sp. W23]|uniref:UDP-N-acetylglucosamine 1-carboxyvinyltransferase n=1 Tax=Ningiella sp. W23 TaxID=3023715 RepID=UPI003757A0E5
MKAIINGGKKLSGEVSVSGAKNSATRVLAAACLSDEEVTLTNFPTELVDVNHKIRFLKEIGINISVDRTEENLTLSASSLRNEELTNYNFPIRTTYLLAPCLLKKNGEARIPYPGGCQIGARGYDLHVMVWEKMGCTVTEHENFIHIKANDSLKGANIKFPISTVGGTESAILCGAIAEGKTEISNAYITPEVKDLIDFMERMGADITVIGSSKIIINGVDHLKGCVKRIMYDRIEALTWLVLAVMSKSSLLIKNVPFSDMTVPLLHLKESGIDFMQNESSIYYRHEFCVYKNPQPFDIACGAHPGIISDMQSFYTLLALVSDGNSKIFDYRYPKRIEYAYELEKQINGGKISAVHGEISVTGPVNFKAANVHSTDLRGSMAVLMAALCAEGESVITRVEMALRGYNRLDEKLKGLGADIKILED